MSKLHPVTIEISNEAISCGDKGGHVLHATTGDQVAWSGKSVQFTLTFKDFHTGVTVWPFTDAQVSWPRGEFNGTLIDAGIPRDYKYTVQISGYADLDPIIIVDKKPQ